MGPRLRALIFGASRWRALFEALLVLVFLLTLEGTIGLTWRLEVGRFSPSALGFILWAAIRLRLTTGSWRRRVRAEGMLGVVVAAVLGIVLALDSVVDPFPVSAPGVSATVRLGGLSVSHDVLGEAARVLAVTLVATTVFLVVRLTWYLWTFWNQLRRTRLVWSLTHAHLLLAVLVSGLIGILLVLRSAQSPHDVVSSLVFLTIGTAIEVLVILPPSALFSYFVARRTTRRIEELAAATGALRAGDYTIRVPVAGRDEVARLQDDFNAMAEALDRAIQDLQGERDTVARLLEARQELLANVSHELRTPVATLRGYLESNLNGAQGTLPETLRHDMHVMERETVRLQALIDDLFSLARADVGQLTLRLEPTDVALLARRGVETIAPLAWQSGRVDVVAHAASPVPPALVDARRFEQILRNLLQNAVRHTPPGGIVAVSVEASPDAVVVQVKDTGEGIAATDLPRVWERFYRAGSARLPTGGTGLGLALVKELTEAMNGTVTVESTLGEGSCFTLRLPLI